MAFSCFASQIKVVSTSPGSIKNKLGSEEWANVEELKIVGPINAEDIAFLHNLTKKDSGNLSIIDLSEANIFMIGEEAFNGGLNLKKILLPNGITAIGKSAFGGCNNLESINIPNKVTGLGAYAFAECYKLQSINIPENVTLISDGCFADCQSLTNIQLSQKTTKIGKEAFARCIALSTIEIPATVASIGGAAFAGCEKLSYIKVDPANKKYLSTQEGVLYSKDRAYVLQYPAGKEDEIYTVLPGVIRIGSYSFSGSKNLKKIIVPTSCTQIGYGAFYECISLKEVNLPLILEKIDQDVFYDCSSLETLTIPSEVKSIGNNAFYNCTSLREITLPKNLQIIGNSAFSGCANLKSINIPEGISTIDNNTFYGCASLKNITLPNSLNSIGNNAFNSDTALEAIDIPMNVNAIGSSVFAGCSNLGKITLPNGIKTIGDATFFRCSKLKTLTLPESVDSTGVGLVANCDSLQEIKINNQTPPKAFILAGYALTDTVKLIVTKGKEEDFHNADGWGQFRHINNFAYEVIHDAEDPTFNNDLYLMEGSNLVAEGGSLVFSNSESNNTISSNSTKEDTTIYKVTDLKSAPQFIGGKSALNEYLKNNCHYPTRLKKTSKGGIVKVKFVVEKDGTLSNIKIVQSQGDDLDAETIASIFSMPNWDPAVLENKKVRCETEVSVIYQIK